MAFASYLGQFDVDAETNRVLDVALEMTRAALGLADDFANGRSPGKSSNLPGPVSGIPIFYVKAHCRNYAGRCSETNGGHRPSAPAPPFSEQVAGRLVWGT